MNKRQRKKALRTGLMRELGLTRREMLALMAVQRHMSRQIHKAIIQAGLLGKSIKVAFDGLAEVVGRQLEKFQAAGIIGSPKPPEFNVWRDPHDRMKIHIEGPALDFAVKDKWEYPEA